jgi:hypothetical protein
MNVFPKQHTSRAILAKVAGLAIGLITLSTAGCIVEAPPSRYWIENNSDITIVVRQSTKVGYLSVTEVPDHQKVEVRGQVHSKSCDSGFEIVDDSSRQLRTLDKVCDGDTIVYP